ncbi:MAG: 16S rRNA (guanine(966)-N(2))-methyltransferase RsmD [Mycoplasma sp.]|nr:16S rRNA (guanine(966)-N(2))-methyltransferase RsmD [Mycoplasma sp.]
MLRIISGEYKGRKIEQPDLKITRPTIDRVREAIFSSIQFKLKNSIILDLFAGSAAFSIEAISRGAMKSIAVENNRQALKVIENNKKKLGISNLIIINRDAVQYTKYTSGVKFDFIFMDPPFKEYDLYNKTLQNIFQNNLLNNNGYIIIETNNKDKIEIPKGYMIQKNKKYGKKDVLLISKI